MQLMSIITLFTGAFLAASLAVALPFTGVALGAPGQTSWMRFGPAVDQVVLPKTTTNDNNQQPQAQAAITTTTITTVNVDDQQAILRQPREVALSAKKHRKQKEFEQDCLAAHNKWRRLHGADDLEFDKKIAEFSRKRADFIAASDGDEFKHPPDLPYGENLAWHSRETTSCDDLIKMWYDEVELYDFAQGQFSHETGHFTQLVWKSTTRVGCAKQVSSGPKGGVYLVCNYDPPGNFLGEAIENVVPARKKSFSTTTTSRPKPTTTTTTTSTTTVAPTTTGAMQPIITTTTTTTTTDGPKNNDKNKRKKKGNKNKKNKKKNKKKKNKKKQPITTTLPTTTTNTTTTTSAST